MLTDTNHKRQSLSPLFLDFLIPPPVNLIGSPL